MYSVKLRVLIRFTNIRVLCIIFLGDKMKLNLETLKGKTVAVTGSTGGLGRELCRYLAELGASIIFCDRNKERSMRLAEELASQFSVKTEHITLDLEDIASVKSATNELKGRNIDVFIHNAGAYSIPRKICETGLDNVFQINFASPYYIIKELLPYLREKEGRVVVVGSIAHNYSKADPNDIDFHTRTAASKVYGNAKRYLMLSLYELFEKEEKVSLSVTHPGITFTNITAHYPKLVFALIKHPMKIIFMKPQKAALSILKGVFGNTEYGEWIGPRFFNIWGKPSQKKLRTFTKSEAEEIFKTAEEIYKDLAR